MNELDDTSESQAGRKLRRVDSATTPAMAAPPPGKQPETSGHEEASEGFFIVGVGASAGGLAALKQLFAHVPADSGLAYVVVVHLSPEHESHLEQLLQPHAAIPVHQVTSTTALEPNHAYVIPPNANLDTIDTHLRLSQLEPRRQERAPIDHFFRTLADTHGSKAIGVVLTGTGADGTLGLRRIKERGGFSLVQDPAEAEFDGMPQSAIAASLVDLVLPMAQIPAAIFRFTATQPRLPLPDEIDGAEPNPQQFLQQVFGIVRDRTGRDFSHYKPSTLIRRIARRMQFHHVQEGSDYLELLRRQPSEVQSLADDVLITVTCFFRDAAVFEMLADDVIPRLFDDKGTNDTVRVWVAGCATGEEAYSVAILLLEEAARRDRSPQLQVFASDMHSGSLERACEGIYPGSIETDVGQKRLDRFFQKEDGSYRVRREVRELITFAPHNILADPPFSRVDLVSCRNLLIYLRRELQQQVTELFHYALRKDGFLLLGSSESVDAGEFFKVVDKKSCIYRKRNVPAPEPRLPVSPVTVGYGRGVSPTTRSSEQIAYGNLHQRLVEQLGPPSVLLSPDDNVVHFSAHAGRYLVHPGGEPTTSVYKLVRPELRVELRATLCSARRQRAVVRTRPVRVRFNGESAPVILDVRPAVEPEHDGFMLLMFDERSHTETATADTASHSDVRHAEGVRAQELEAERLDAEQKLQSIIEEYETSQEELRASNEELQSANEELRSALEELETSKEELQSMNEELQTLNQENRHRVDELSQLSSDLQNLLAATDIATLFLDRQLRILRFTPRVSELFSVRTTDRGRTLSDFTSRLGYDGLPTDAIEVLENLIPIERELQDESGRWYLTRLLPYRSPDDRISGVVITFVEITQRKLAEDELRQEKERSERIIETLPEPLLVLTPELTVQSANAAFYDQFKVAPELTIGRKVYDLGDGQWNIPSLRKLLEEVLPSNRAFTGYPVEHEFQDLGARMMVLHGRQLEHAPLILLGIEDVTERHRTEQALRASQRRLSKMINVGGVGILMFDQDGAVIDSNDTALELLGYSRANIETRNITWQDMTPPEDVETSRRREEQLELTGRIEPYEKECLRKDGSRTWLLFAGASLGDGTVVKYCIDVNDRKRAEHALRTSEDQLAAELAAMQRLHELVARLLVRTDLAAALDDVLAAAMEITGAPMGHVQLLDAKRGTLDLVAHRGFDRRFVEHLVSTPMFGPATGALQSGRRVVVKDVRTDPAYEEHVPDAHFAGYRGMQATPLTSRSGEMLGVLSTHYPNPYHPGERDLRLLDLYARQAADFIDRMRADELVRQSEARLGEENRNKDEYLAMLGHELRNPLAAIRNATELLQLAEPEDTRVRRACGVLKRQSTHVSRIIDGLLEVSRIARGKVELQLEPLDVREVLDRVFEDTSTQMSRRGLKLEAQLGSEPLHIECDEIRLVQVLDNLLGNAMKFTPAPGSIFVTAERENAWALVRIRDTGVGIRAEMLERIFDTFQQEEQNVDRSRGGLGLGLALAKGLVELHGGKIEAFSAGLGSGSEFRIRLPLTSRRTTDRPSEIGIEFVPRRVLVVEDNEDGAQMLRDLLDMRGHHVTVVGDGSAALEALRQTGADLVLCDLGLPGMSGYEVVKTVRADDTLRSIPVVALTGYSQTVDRRRTSAAGFDAHLVKPVDLKTLDGVLAQLGDGRKQESD